jgi:hypothetical protein
MNGELRNNESIAAYLAGRLSADEVAALEDRLTADPAFAAEVASLAPVSSWLRRSFDAGPSANYRLSSERITAIRATSRGDIVEFPARAQTPVRRRSRALRIARRYGLAAAAAVAMIAGGISGFESGRIQYTESSESVLLAIDLSNSRSAADEADMIPFYPPAYGLDHADFGAMASRYSGAAHPSGQLAHAAQPTRDYGLPGPVSPYLRSGELLFLQ